MKANAFAEETRGTEGRAHKLGERNFPRLVEIFGHSASLLPGSRVTLRRQPSSWLTRAEPPICVLRGAEWIGIPSVQNWLI